MAPRSTVVSLTSLVKEELSLMHEDVAYPLNRTYSPDILYKGFVPIIKVHAPGEDAAVLSWGLDFRTWEKTDGPAPTYPDVGRITFILDELHADKLSLLDEHCRSMMQTGSWTDTVKSTQNGRQATVKLYITGKGTSPPTQFKICKKDGSFACGEGWKFINEHSSASASFRDASCRVAFTPHYWSMNGSAGLTLAAVAVVLCPAETCSDIDSIFPDDDIRAR
jgi:hypothetical protein